MPKFRSLLRYARKTLKKELDCRRDKLTRASLSITQRCNMRCNMCPWWQEGATAPQMPEEVWLRVIDELAAEGVRRIGVTGGEPSLHPGFEVILRRIRSHDIELGLTTNGLTLKHFMPLYAETVDDITISMDAPDELHDEIRGLKGASERIFNAIHDLLEYRESNGYKRPRVTLHTTVMKQNVSKITAMAAAADQLGVDVVSFQYVSCIPKDSVASTVVDGATAATDVFTGESSDSMLLDESDVKVFREQMASLPKTKNCLVVIDPLRRLSDQSLLTGKFPVKRCTLISNLLGINPSGETSVCAYLGKYTMGNIQEMSVAEIWHGEARRKLVRALRRKLFPVCAYCCSLGYMLTPGQLVKVAMGRQL